ncbi:MAG: hypothetical protein ACPLXL_01885 [Minisyncoccia bacterium]
MKKNPFILLAKEPPSHLKEKILFMVEKEKIKKERRKAVGFFGGFFFFSLISLPYSWPLFLEEIKNSGLLYFLKTMFGLFLQKKIFLIFQREFFYAFIDFFPLNTFLFVLINLFFIFLSIHYFLKNIAYQGLIKKLKFN